MGLQLIFICNSEDKRNFPYIILLCLVLFQSQFTPSLISMVLHTHNLLLIYIMVVWYVKDEVKPEVDEVTHNSTAELSHQHNTEEAAPQERGLLPQEILDQANTWDTRNCKIINIKSKSLLLLLDNNSQTPNTSCQWGKK